MHRPLAVCRPGDCGAPGLLARPRRVPQNEARGIDVRHFGELLTVSGVVLNEDVSGRHPGLPPLLPCFLPC